jgi:hypothetical protein
LKEIKFQNCFVIKISDEARLYEKLGDYLVLCTACFWYCRIAPNQVGICATRLNQKGMLYSLVYGSAIGLHLDPVEKKRFFIFIHGENFYFLVLVVVILAFYFVRIGKCQIKSKIKWHTSAFYLAYKMLDFPPTLVEKLILA